MTHRTQLVALVTVQALGLRSYSKLLVGWLRASAPQISHASIQLARDARLLSPLLL